MFESEPGEENCKLSQHNGGRKRISCGLTCMSRFKGEINRDQANYLYQTPIKNGLPTEEGNKEDKVNAAASRKKKSLNMKKKKTKGVPARISRLKRPCAVEHGNSGKKQRAGWLRIRKRPYRIRPRRTVTSR